ncbi:anti-sigma-D factor RsdA [Nocardia sp. CNY236]|uniref:anti-sigma-D factor RsdA n=1 Tax=Nocardia sp. CNY236 TaxID=1169152 RepID=UPI0004163986|nr:anti-sigma-D factor RsdA [Nocardia sp. CNY236]
MARDGEGGPHDWKAQLGSPNSGPYAEASADVAPVDIVAVRRDDALIDAIASGGPVNTDDAEEHRFATLLRDWRAELIAAPMPAEPDLDVIVAAVNQEIGARQVRQEARSGARLRLLRPILGFAAAVALVIGGMTAFSYGAEPGDPLWRVKEVVFSEQAQTTVVQRADDDLTEASALVTQNPTQAKERLERAKENATQVSNVDKRNELMTEWQRLFVELRKVSPGLADQLEPVTAQSGDSVTPSSASTTTTTSSGAVTSDSGPTVLRMPGEGGSAASQSADATEPNPDATTVPPTGSAPTVVTGSLSPTTPPAATTAPTEPPRVTEEPTPPPDATTAVPPPGAEPSGNNGQTEGNSGQTDAPEPEDSQADRPGQPGR